MNNDLSKPKLSRRDLLSTAAAATGALVVGFWMPQRAPAQIASPEGAAWATEPAVDESQRLGRRRARRYGDDPHRPDRDRPGCVDLQRHDGVRGAAMRLEQGPAAICVRQSRRPGNGAGMDAQSYGQRRHRPLWRRRARVRHARPHRLRGNPEQPLPAHADQRRRVGEGRPLLSSACRRGSARAAAVGGRQVLGRAGRRGEFGQQRYHPPPDGAHHHVWQGCRARGSDAASKSRADPHQAAVGMDADGHRAEESRCPFESHRQSRLRHRRSDCPA